MEAIPEETSKVNLNSSHSRFAKVPSDSTIGMMRAQRANQTVLASYVTDLIQAGKTEDELTDDVELYYQTLVNNCDKEILDLKEELEVERASFRHEAAEEVYLKASELDELSNTFIECIFA